MTPASGFEGPEPGVLASWRLTVDGPPKRAALMYQRLVLGMFVAVVVVAGTAVGCSNKNSRGGQGGSSAMRRRAPAGCSAPSTRSPAQQPPVARRPLPAAGADQDGGGDAGARHGLCRQLHRQHLGVAAVSRERPRRQRGLHRGHQRQRRARASTRPSGSDRLDPQHRNAARAPAAPAAATSSQSASSARR